MRHSTPPILGLIALVGTAGLRSIASGEPHPPQAQAPVVEEETTLLAVHGKVVHWKTGEPLQGAELRFSQQDRTSAYKVETDETGGFETPASFRRTSVLADDPIVVSGLLNEAGPPLRFEPEWIREPGPGREHVLRAFPPIGELVIDPVFIDGDEDCDMEWLLRDSSGNRLELSGPVWKRRRTWIHEGTGLTFPLSIRGTCSRSCMAPRSRNLASDQVLLESLPDEPVVVPVYAPGSLRVLVKDGQGRFARGVAVRAIHEKDAAGPLHQWRLEPREDGRCWITGLAAGEWKVVVVDRITGAEVESRRVRLGRSEELEIEIEVPDTWQPELAVSGRILWQDEAYTTEEALLVQVGTNRWIFWETDRQGQFEVWGGESTASLVRGVANVFLTGPCHEPFNYEVPFGTEDLSFRQLGTAPTTRCRIELVDDETGSPIESDAMVFLCDRVLEGVPWGYRDIQRDEDRGWAAELPSRSHATWRAVAAGYRTRKGEFPAVAEREATPSIEIRLERGFEHDLCLVDDTDERPCAEARVIDERGRLLGVSDERGVVRMSGNRWPAHIEIRAPGYRSSRWPQDLSGPGFDGYRWVALSRE